MKDPKDILINGIQLSKILEFHKKWVLGKVGGVRANLGNANLFNANLYGANLFRANLERANLDSVKNAELHIARTYIAPETGDYTGYKKTTGEHGGSVITQLLIPEDAKRSNATGRKCRASHAKVIAHYNMNGDRLSDDKVTHTNVHGPLTTYKVGEIVHCDEWDDNRWNECSGGIHHFITRAEAEAW